MNTLKEIYTELCNDRQMGLVQELTETDYIVRSVIILNLLNLEKYPNFMNVIKHIHDALDRQSYTFNYTDISKNDEFSKMVSSMEYNTCPTGDTVDPFTRVFNLIQTLLSNRAINLKNVPVENKTSILIALQSTMSIHWPEELVTLCNANRFEEMVEILEVMVDLLVVDTKLSLTERVKASINYPTNSTVVCRYYTIFDTIINSAQTTLKNLHNRRQKLLDDVNAPMSSDVTDNTITNLKLNEALKQLVIRYQMPVASINLTASITEILMRLDSVLSEHPTAFHQIRVDIYNGDLAAALVKANTMLNTKHQMFEEYSKVVPQTMYGQRRIDINEHPNYRAAQLLYPFRAR